MHPVLRVENILVVAPTAEEAHLNVNAAGTEGFLAIHGVPDGFASVLFRPYAGQSAGVLQANVNSAKRHNPGHAPFDSSVDLGVTAIEIVLAVRAAGVVGVGTGCHADL